MKIRFLGAHHREAAGIRMASLLIDGVLALDAGGLTGGLTLAEQLRLKAVLLSHQHYDHVRDIPALGMTCYLGNSSVDVYAPAVTLESLHVHLLDNQLYPDFTTRPEGKPTIRFCPMKEMEATAIGGYAVTPLPVSHSVPAVGYLVAREGRSLFYTGDCGPDLEAVWRVARPDLLVIEVTASNRFIDFARDSHHLSPSLLREELSAFRCINGYLPRVVTTHTNPDIETEIRAELVALGAELGADISVATEGLELPV